MAKKKTSKKVVKKAVLRGKASISVNGKIYYRGDEIPAVEFQFMPKRVKAFCGVTEQEVKED